MRTLSTAHHIAKQMDIKEMVVVPGLCACAAATVEQGLDNLDLLSLDEMKDLCPQMAIRIADEAPTSFEGSCQWVAARQMTDGNISGESTPLFTCSPVLLVTHREGMRDLLGKRMNLPYCSIANFRATCDSKGQVQFRFQILLNSAGERTLLGQSDPSIDKMLAQLKLLSEDKPPAAPSPKTSQPTQTVQTKTSTKLVHAGGHSFLSGGITKKKESKGEQKDERRKSKEEERRTERRKSVGK